MLENHDTRAMTLDDVARVAGVSRATVSRVVNNVSTVDPRLRRRVERAIAQTGYVPNQAARSLVTRSAGSIALAVSDLSAGQIFSDPFFGRIVNGLTKTVRPRGVQLMLNFVDDASSREALVASLRYSRIDGVVLVSTQLDDPLPALLAEARVPAVLAARPAQPVPVVFVELDQRAGVFLAVDRLVATGRRHLATIAGPMERPGGRARLDAFRERLAYHGMAEADWAESDFTQAGGAAAMRSILGRHPEVDGVFAASDLMAAGAITVLHRAGRDVPGEIGVVGFDDHAMASTGEPPLTTVHQPVEEMAAQMAELLLQQIADPSQVPQSRIFQPELMVRESG